ncbi:hypothetical protein [Nocardia sp. NPDC050710]|uniref:hypothetical protein n=1 Tax=Nocardia sp. NPDC050710 TaxID=3157220 RepID=UPI0034086BD2
MSYVYMRTEPQLWTVGFYKPNGEWEPESDHDRKDRAADRVIFLNGRGSDTDVAELIRQHDELREECKELVDQVQCLQWDYSALVTQHDRCADQPVGKGA